MYYTEHKPDHYSISGLLLIDISIAIIMFSDSD